MQTHISTSARKVGKMPTSSKGCVYCGEIVDEVILENRRWLKTGIGPINKESRSGIAQGRIK